MNTTVNKAIPAIKSIFFVCGFALSSWAPMVPFAKNRLNLNDGELGLLLLMLGGGAILMMPISGYLGQKIGNRIVITVSCLIIAFILPFLVFLDNVTAMATALFIFGAGIGTVDVSMNAVGVNLQNLYGRPIMSSLHGLFSVGGLVGSLGLGLLIKTGLEPLHAAVFIAVLVLLTVAFQYRKLFDASSERQTASTHSEEKESVSGGKFAWMNRGVLFLGMLCFIVFMSEGAMLDWSALFLHENRGMDESRAGIGYAVFSVAMAIMRLFGDGLVEKLSHRTVVTGGALTASAGLLMVILSPWISLTILGFFILGCGAANIVPVFFNEAGKLKNVPVAAAVAAISTMGYSGQLLGPVSVGFIAELSSLGLALGVCSLLLAGVGISYFLFMNKSKS
ncbi:MFS transporter [Flavobacterium ustbae]|uniref:MFS transporter n=1 Tax=Flavobacterium ustbae TaxID=2488790 RepID=UPI000F7889BA|nr:MFS transporter [Flavobacterium ustbae]